MVCYGRKPSNGAKLKKLSDRPKCWGHSLAIRQDDVMGCSVALVGGLGPPRSKKKLFVREAQGGGLKSVKFLIVNVIRLSSRGS